MQAFGIAAAFHHAAGELVDDDDLVVLDDVIDVAGEQRVGAQRLVGVVHQRDVADVVERALLQQADARQQLLDMLGAFLGEGDVAGLLVLLVVARASDAPSACRPCSRARNCPRSGRR